MHKLLQKVIKDCLNVRILLITLCRRVFLMSFVPCDDPERRRSPPVSALHNSGKNTGRAERAKLVDRFTYPTQYTTHTSTHTHRTLHSEIQEINQPLFDGEHTVHESSCITCWWVVYGVRIVYMGMGIRYMHMCQRASCIFFYVSATSSK